MFIQQQESTTIELSPFPQVKVNKHSSCGDQREIAPEKLERHQQSGLVYLSGPTDRAERASQHVEITRFLMTFSPVAIFFRR